MTGWLLDGLASAERWLGGLRTRRRWARLQELGMRIGTDVVLPPSTWIDVAHCYLITIGDRARFGPQCLVLAHDAQMDEFLDAGRLGRVVVGADCRIGARTVILCNVEIGEATVVEAGSVVATSLPARSYCAGSPARVVCSIDEYGRRVQREMAGRRRYAAGTLRDRLRIPSERTSLLEELSDGAVLVETGAGRVAPHEDRGL